MGQKQLRNLILDSRGFSLVEIVATLVISGAVLGGFAKFMWHQQQSAVHIRQKIQVLEFETVLAKIAGDVRACSCIFNGSQAMNNVGANLRINPSLASAGRGDAAKQKIDIRWFPQIGQTASGQCDYTQRYSLAAEGTYLGNPGMNLLVKDIYIDGIHRVGEQSLNQVRGTITVEFEHILQSGPEAGKQLTKRPIKPAQADVVFFTDAAGNATTCDPRGAMDTFFEDRLDAFKSDQREQFDSGNITYRQERETAVGNVVTQTERRVRVHFEELDRRLASEELRREAEAERERQRILQETREALGL